MHSAKGGGGGGGGGRGGAYCHHRFNVIVVKLVHKGSLVVHLGNPVQ